MIYIQSKIENNIFIPHHFDAACAMYGAIDSALDFKLISIDEIRENNNISNLIKTGLFVGSVEFMREIFSTIGIDDVRVPINSNRKSEIITLGDAKKRASLGEKIFIKPIKIKEFTGFVLDQMSYSCLNGVSESTNVLAYQPFSSPIESEWRIYVHNNKIVDSRNYSGDFLISPDYNYASIVINQNKNSFPCAYTIDVGVLESGENVVVEFNDFWAIGNYGIPNDIYIRMLRERYFEILKTRK